MRILVTGAAGRLGGALADQLVSRGHDVVGVDVAPLGRTPPQPFAFTVSSFATMDLPRDLDVVAHLACSTVPAGSATSPEMDVVENVLPGVDLFLRAVKTGVRKVVFTSSGGTVYGDMPAERASLRESDACRPTTAHGAMKYALETYLRAITHGTGTVSVSARIANAYGRPGPLRPGHGAVDTFVRAVERGAEISVWGDGSTVRDYVHFSDIVAALTCIIESEKPSPIYNIGSGRGTSLRELIDLIEKRCGKKANVRFAPSRTVDLSRNVLDTSLARAELGWAPAVDLAEGVARVASTARCGDAR